MSSERPASLRRGRRSRRRRAAAATALAVTVGATVWSALPATAGSSGRKSTDATTTAAGQRATSATAATATSSTGAAKAAKARRTLASTASGDTHLGVAALNLTTGATVTEHASTHFFTASIVKVDIATTLLRQAAAAHRSLTSTQRSLMAAMIEQSDDTAASTLWDEIGGHTGLTATDRALGLTHTTAGTGSYWGLTSTTAVDQLTLLRAVFDGDALNHSDRSYLTRLMESVTASQRWGLGAATTSGDTLAVKDGWLPHEADDYRWITNSIGRISSSKATILVVVLSNHHPTEDEGIDLDGRLAKLAVAAVS